VILLRDWPHHELRHEIPQLNGTAPRNLCPAVMRPTNLLGRERTQHMVTLTRYFHVFTSRVAARLSAVRLSAWHIAKTWYVCTLSGTWVCHK